MDNSAEKTDKSLYERLGGELGVRKIVNDVLDKNYSNPLIGYHFKIIDMVKLKQLVFEFFSMGTGGPHTYTGRDMRSSHAALKINEDEWASGTEDMEWALDKNGIGQEDKDVVIAILESFKGDIVKI